MDGQGGLTVFAWWDCMTLDEVAGELKKLHNVRDLVEMVAIRLRYVQKSRRVKC